MSWDSYELRHFPKFTKWGITIKSLGFFLEWRSFWTMLVSSCWCFNTWCISYHSLMVSVKSQYNIHILQNWVLTLKAFFSFIRITVDNISKLMLKFWCFTSMSCHLFKTSDKSWDSSYQLRQFLQFTKLGLDITSLCLCLVWGSLWTISINSWRYFNALCLPYHLFISVKSWHLSYELRQFLQLKKLGLNSIFLEWG